MGTRIVCRTLAAAITAVFYCSSLAAHEPPAKSLLQQANWLRFEVSGGRLVARSERCNQSRHAAEMSEGETGRQSLLVEAAGSGFTVFFDRQLADRRLLLRLDDKGQLMICRELSNPAASGNVALTQSAAGKLALTLGGATPRRLAADDLWQLLLVEQEACRSQLLPLLEEVSVGQDLPRTLAAIEEQLLARAGNDIHEQRRQWQAWVDELVSSDYSRRQAADVKLRAGGQGLLAFLRQLDPAGLDGEQRRRIRTMLAELPSGGSDTPEVVAEWLLADKRVWLALMSRGELPQRAAAAEHLSKLCGRPVLFDPAASDESRTAQLAELSRMLADN